MRVVVLTIVVLAGLLLVPLADISASAAPGPARTPERPILSDPFDDGARPPPTHPVTPNPVLPQIDDALNGEADGSGPIQHDDGAHEPEPTPTAPEPSPGDDLAGSEPTDDSDCDDKAPLHVPDQTIVVDEVGFTTAGAPPATDHETSESDPAPTRGRPWPQATLDAIGQLLDDLFAAV